MNRLLDDITLININTIDPKTSVDVLNFCSNSFTFSNVILFSNSIPENITSNIEYVKVDISKVYDYNKFILQNLCDYVNTTYCIIVQNDGFIINPHLWSDDFLNFDYIGAPWSIHQMKVWNRTNRIGNGGFSLRSKRLLEYTKKLGNIDFNLEEDVITSLLLENNKNFNLPTIKIAAKFSLETHLDDHPNDLTKCFGFHGKHLVKSVATLYSNLNLK